MKLTESTGKIIKLQWVKEVGRGRLGYWVEMRRRGWKRVSR